MGRMEFSSETSEVSHTIALHANLVLLSSRVFLFRHSSKVGRAKRETFLVCVSNCECQGATHPDFFSRAKKLSYTRGVIALHGLTVYILGVFGSTRGSFQNCADRKKIEGPGTCAVDNACAKKNSASLTS